MMAALVVFEADGVRVLTPAGTIEGILIGDEVGVRCDGTACSGLEDVRCFLRKFIAEKPCDLEKTEKLEQLRALWMGGRIAVIRTEDEGVGVDTPEDAERVGKILAGRMA